MRHLPWAREESRPTPLWYPQEIKGKLEGRLWYFFITSMDFYIAFIIRTTNLNHLHMWSTLDWALICSTKNGSNPNFLFSKAGLTPDLVAWCVVTVLFPIGGLKSGLGWPHDLKSPSWLVSSPSPWLPGMQSSSHRQQAACLGFVTKSLHLGSKWSY